MHIYFCKVRLGGSLYNEVPKEITAPELAVLKVLHGEDAVADIKHLRNDPDRKIEGERERLNDLYGGALSKLDDVKSLNGIFGVAGQLPAEIPGVAIDYDGKGAPKKQGRPKNVEEPVDDLEALAL